MRYVWFPRVYAALWLLFLLSLGLYGLQVKKPQKYNRGEWTQLGQRMTMASGILLIGATLYVFGYSWEQQIVAKRKCPEVELVQRERSYGGTVFVRRLPRRIWKAVEEGDRLKKPAWSIVVRVEQRRRRTQAAS